MRKLKIAIVSLLAVFIYACGSTDAMTSKVTPQVLEAYYNVYVGGTQEAALSRSYFMVLDTVLPNYKAFTMQVDGRALSLEKSRDENMFVGSERYAVKDELPDPEQLSLLMNYGVDTIRLEANAPEFRQTITFPSAPPRN